MNKISLGIIDGFTFYFKIGEFGVTDQKIQISRENNDFAEMCLYADEIETGKHVQLYGGNKGIITKELNTYLPQYKKALEKAKKLMVLL